MLFNFVSFNVVTFFEFTSYQILKERGSTTPKRQREAAPQKRRRTRKQHHPQGRRRKQRLPRRKKRPSSTIQTKEERREQRERQKQHRQNEEKQHPRQGRKARVTTTLLHPVQPCPLGNTSGNHRDALPSHRSSQPGRHTPVAREHSDFRLFTTNPVAVEHLHHHVSAFCREDRV